MRFYELILGLTAIPVLSAANSDSTWWENDGDLCRIPEGSYKSSCPNVSMEFCSNLPLDQTPCKFNLDCYSEPERATFSSATIFLPRGVQFFNVSNLDGNLSHPVINTLQEQQRGVNFVCNPCKLPDGNYKNSCTKISIRHLAEQKTCLFRAECDKGMRKDRRCVTNRDYKHNEVLIPEYTALTDVKNLNGDLIHPSNMLKSVQDFCYETGENEPVAENSAWIGKASKVTIATVGASLLLTL